MKCFELTCNRGQQLDADDSAIQGAPSPFAELLILDSTTSQISPPLPLTRRGLVKNHAALFLMPRSPTGLQEAFAKVVEHEQQFKEKRYDNKKIVTKLTLHKERSLQSLCSWIQCMELRKCFFHYSYNISNCQHVCLPSPKFLVIADHAPSIDHFGNDELIPLVEFGTGMCNLRSF